MKQNRVQISVLMPVYNGEKFLRLAVESILNQTVSEFEFIIIDDGSVDRTASILDSYTDPRIVRITHSTNYGLSRSLNDGIALAHGEYIARMDADDISSPDRLEKQVEFMENHPDIGVCGTWRKIINSDGGIVREKKPPVEDELIKWFLCFRTVSLAHPSVMMRKDLCEMVGMYDERYRVAQDYDLWRKLSSVTKFSNIPEFLLHYRVHGSNITVQCDDLSEKESTSIAIEMMNNLLGDHTGEQYYSLADEDPKIIVEKVKIVERIFQKLTFHKNLSKNAVRALRKDAGHKITRMTRPYLSINPVQLYWFVIGRLWQVR